MAHDADDVPSAREPSFELVIIPDNVGRKRARNSAAFDGSDSEDEQPSDRRRRRLSKPQNWLDKELKEKVVQQLSARTYAVWAPGFTPACVYYPQNKKKQIQAYGPAGEKIVSLKNIANAMFEHFQTIMPHVHDPELPFGVARLQNVLIADLGKCLQLAEWEDAGTRLDADTDEEIEYKLLHRGAGGEVTYSGVGLAGLRHIAQQLADVPGALHSAPTPSKAAAPSKAKTRTTAAASRRASGAASAGSKPVSRGPEGYDGGTSSASTHAASPEPETRKPAPSGRASNGAAAAKAAAAAASRPAQRSAASVAPAVKGRSAQWLNEELKKKVIERLRGLETFPIWPPGYVPDCVYYHANDKRQFHVTTPDGRRLHSASTTAKDILEHVTRQMPHVNPVRSGLGYGVARLQNVLAESGQSLQGKDWEDAGSNLEVENDERIEWRLRHRPRGGAAASSGTVYEGVGSAGLRDIAQRLQDVAGVLQTRDASTGAPAQQGSQRAQDGGADAEPRINAQPRPDAAAPDSAPSQGQAPQGQPRPPAPRALPDVFKRKKPPMNVGRKAVAVPAGERLGLAAQRWREHKTSSCQRNAKGMNDVLSCVPLSQLLNRELSLPEGQEARAKAMLKAVKATQLKVHPDKTGDRDDTAGSIFLQELAARIQKQCDDEKFDVLEEALTDCGVLFPR